MPLPWKKTRGNRISRIVADLQPQKRGSSLVVETGFPTSVIDLFVKNRDRMIKRQSSKKKIFSNHIDPYIIDSNSIAPPPTPLPSPDYSSFLRGNVVNSALIEGNLGILEDEIRHVGGGRENENGVLVMKKIVFFVLGLVLVLVFLGLGIKKLVVGVTLLAFLLFFVERFGKFVVGFLKPCSNVKMGINYWIEKVYGWFLIFMEWKISLIKREDSDDSDSGCELIDGGGGGEEEASSCSIEEIQVLESNFINHNSEENERHDFLSREKRWGCLDYEEEQRKMNLASKNNQHQHQPRSKSAKLKAKIIRKLIPKKLRSGKKLMKSTNKVEEVAGYQMGLDEEQNQNQNQNQNESMSSYEEEQEQEEAQEDGKNGGMNENCEFSETGIMIGKRNKNNLMEKECIFLVVIILSGLLGGRFQAIVLSISGCFMFKLIKVLLNLK